MTARIIDGKAIAARVRQSVAEGVRGLLTRLGRAPGLHVILVGEDPASQTYVRNKEKATAEVGIVGVVHRLDQATSLSSLLGLIDELNRDPTVDGILVQLPLPQGMDVQVVLERIDPSKDVDGFHPVNIGKLWSGLPGFVPCTPKGCLRMLREAEVELRGARAVILGRSNIVGKPMGALLMRADATVTFTHSRTRDLPERCREADLVVAAIGKPRFVKADWIRPSATVIDVGINRDAEGRLCGDVDTEQAREVAAHISPVPGGVGPMTIAMLLENTLESALARA